MYYKSLVEELKVNSGGRFVITEEISSTSSLIIKAVLKSKDLVTCPHCLSNNTIKFGKKERVLRDDYISNRQTIIHLTYNRFKCKDCLRLWNDSLPTLEAKTSISLSLKLNIIEDLKKDVSFTFIADKRNVSIQTVIDIFETYVHYERRPFGDVICMDEFKNLKHSDGKYAFVMFDPNASKINDILENRLQANIDKYLYSIPWNEKKKVKYVITDMSESYRTLIRKHFYNATHIIDCFHYMRYVEDAFNNVRIRIQRFFGEETPEYRILKRYWRLLSTFQFDVEDGEFYNPIRKKSTTINQILLDATSVHPELNEAYELTQFFLYSLKNTKYEEAEKWYDEWLSKIKESNCKEFVELTTMFNNWRKEIINSFIRFGDKRLHNGYIEGMNNKIKVIKRIAYGYTNFYHFRNRIMHIVNNDEYVLKVIDRESINRKKRNKKI